MNQPKLKIFNAKVITPAGIIPNATVLVDEGVITGVSQHDIAFEGALMIDAKGKYISPGFIDIHVHGGRGCDFMDAGLKALCKVFSPDLFGIDILRDELY